MTTRRACLFRGLAGLVVIALTSSLALSSARAQPTSSPAPISTSGATVSSAAAAAAASATTAARQTRAVVELFTSQGCSSCPAADRLLGELKKDPTLIAVSLPITYWDYLGWKDTLADPRHTARQTAYSHARGDRAVYTPQVVVNGLAHALGSDRSAIETALARSRGKDTLSVPVRVSVADGRISVSADTGRTLPASSRATGEVWLLGVSSSVAVQVGRGENTGRTLVYSNVVRRWVKLGDWTGATRTWSVAVSDIKSDKIDAVAVLLQDGNASAPGPILGAAFERLN
ncbi:hypothetical protein RHODGE_RHODGE_01788 [Rhodoplanes serenus]|uniref:DUF1223 domain-containing protein n=1 Tax=Rhodoplanes serenus TaxID=200615 RepID=A0A447CTL5_9BRAD|nr:DUF1223 domain-containing protein [Rhodoplanes serenus]VCU08623.1 hypothetical protein RHODGE_RHODGE_01788 [Rhodoplanes serenus]